LHQIFKISIGLKNKLLLPMKLTQILAGLMMLLISVVIVPPTSTAQIKKIEYGTIAVDTLTDDGTNTFAFSKVTSDVYDISWQVNATNISGTTDVFVTLEGSNCASCSDWATIDTATLSGSTLSHIFVQPNFPALRARVKAVGTGTQSTEIDNHYYWRRRKP
jgi:uncharacterized protein with beta-barrel porin domain